MRIFKYEKHLKLLKINIKNLKGDMTWNVLKCYKKHKKMLWPTQWQKMAILPQMDTSIETF